MKLELFIAARYLFAKKSHNVINVISAISAIGLGIGTAALILILSIYNGFDTIIRNNLSDLDPDVLVCPREGRFFHPDELEFRSILADGRVDNVCTVLEDNVFVRYGEQQGVALAKAVDTEYETSSPLASHITEGYFRLHKGEVKMSVVGYSLAHSLCLHPRFATALEIWYPDRSGRISMTNPGSSLHRADTRPAGIFSIDSSTDAQLVIMPIETLRSLMNDENIASGVEIRLTDSSRKAVKRFISDHKNDGNFILKDRYQQHSAIYKMMKYEKMAIFIILIFVVIIVSFNIFGSLSMLVIEKRNDCSTLMAMGATPETVKRIFTLEGWMISLLGLAGGIAVGLGIIILQKFTGFVQMPGNYLVSAYPVELHLSDLILTIAAVAGIGLCISVLSSRNVKTNI